METKNIKYPYLPEDRTIMYVSKDNGFMKQAKKIAWTDSTDRRMPTGAVVVNVNDNVVVSEATNKAPITNPWLLKVHKKYCLRRIFKIPSGKKYWVCPGCAAGDHHAEYRSVKKLIKKGFSKNDQFDLYLWGHYWACKDCWGKILEIPIRNVYLQEGSEIDFNEKTEGNIIGHQFDEFR